MPAVLNAANELAVRKFLNRQIPYLTIIDMIEESMNAHKKKENPTVNEILDAEKETYELIESRW